MIQHNFNRSASCLGYLILLLSAGCAQQSQNARIVDIETPPAVSKLDNAYNPRPGHPLIEPQFSTSTSTFTPTTAIVKEYSTVWDRLISLYALPEVDNNRVDRELAWFLNNRDYLYRIQERAEPYIYNILEEIEKKQIPGELALLPVVESAFQPHAYSRSHAAGLWQFIPATGRLFGLKQNWWYDGRRDVYASTQAATSYLQQLAETFNGDWLLALASYNAGKGRVGKAIKKNQRYNRATDYWSLRLPRETMNYVPRLLAVAKIFANAEHYNIPLRPIANKPVFEAVNIGSQLDINKAATMANISMDDFFKLNPGFNRWYTDPQGPHRLLIPVEQADVFRKNLAKLPETERLTWKRHKIIRGENLGLIARKHRTSVKVIRQVNQLASNTIWPGHYLFIPDKNNSYGKHPFKPRQAKLRNKRRIYTVKRGDSLWRIAQKFSVSSKNLASWNNLRLNSVLRPGQKLIVKKGRRTNVAFSSTKYTVRKGDSLFNISRKFNVTVANLRKWNSNSMGKYLYPGQKLKVKVDVSQPST